MRTRAGRSSRSSSADTAGPLLLKLLCGELAPDGSDARWPDLIALARRHGVAPLLHETARSLPPLIERQLRRERAAVLADAAAREGGEGRVLAALVGLRPVLIKGAAYARTLYSSAELRPRGDFDVLIAPGVAEQAAARLALLGYVRHQAARGGVLDDPSRHEQTLVHPREPHLVLDLHRGFCQTERSQVDVGALVARAVESDRGGLVLSPDDAVLAHAINLGTHELRVPLVHVADLARLWARCTPEVVTARARSYRVERALICALSLLERCALLPADAGGTVHDERRASFAGARVDLIGIRRLLQRLFAAQPAPARAALQWMVSRYDLARRPLGRLEQLARKALLIDRMSDRVRFAFAHGASLLRTAARSAQPPDVLSWRA